MPSEEMSIEERLQRGGIEPPASRRVTPPRALPLHSATAGALRRALTLSMTLAAWPAFGVDIDRIAPLSAGDPAPCADRAPDVAVQPGGSFLLIWQRSGCPNGATRRIRAQRFDAVGRPAAPAIELWDGAQPRTVPLPDGGFAAVSEFESSLRPQGPAGIGLHRLDAFGRPKGGATVVAIDPNDLNPNTQPRLAVAPNGSVIVVWRDSAGIPRGRFFDVAFRPLTDALALSPLAAPPFGETDPDVAIQSDGTALAVWAHFVDTNEYQVVGRRFSSSGVALSPAFPISRSERFRINVEPRVVRRGADGWWVGWKSQQGLPAGPPPISEVRIERLATNGASMGSEQPFVDSDAIESFALGGEAAGNLLVLVGEKSGAVAGRWFDSAGLPASDRVRLSGPAPQTAALPALPDRSSGAIPATWSLTSAGVAGTDLSGSLLSPPCIGGPSAACLGLGGRYRVEVVWRSAAGSGTAKALPLSGNVATFGIRNTADHDVTVLLAGPGGKNLTFAATTNLALEIRVTDRTSGMLRTFAKAAGRFESRRIVNALPTAALDGGFPPPVAGEREATAEVFSAIDPVPPVATVGEACVPTSGALCLLGGRFRAELLAEQDPRPTSALSRTDRSGGLALGRAPESPVVLLSMVDGRATNGKFWVQLGGLASGAYKVKITDLTNGAVRLYSNPVGRLESRLDRTAF